jgi:hypothetical protein
MSNMFVFGMSWVDPKTFHIKRYCGLDLFKFPQSKKTLNQSIDNKSYTVVKLSTPHTKGAPLPRGALPTRHESARVYQLSISREIRPPKSSDDTEPGLGLRPPATISARNHLQIFHSPPRGITCCSKHLARRPPSLVSASTAPHFPLVDLTFV